MGGAQVTFNIDESLRHADTVVAGEAEGAWQRCLRTLRRETWARFTKTTR